eukprot:7495160-Lingulodinium_polyedra.AAC.1
MAVFVETPARNCGPRGPRNKSSNPMMSRRPARRRQNANAPALRWQNRIVLKHHRAWINVSLALRPPRKLDL